MKASGSGQRCRSCRTTVHAMVPGRVQCWPQRCLSLAHRETQWMVSGVTLLMPGAGDKDVMGYQSVAGLHVVNIRFHLAFINQIHHVLEQPSGWKKNQ